VNEAGLVAGLTSGSINPDTSSEFGALRGRSAARKHGNICFGAELHSGRPKTGPRDARPDLRPKSVPVSVTVNPLLHMISGPGRRNDRLAPS
jgi:hypothetical protein